MQGTLVVGSDGLFKYCPQEHSRWHGKRASQDMVLGELRAQFDRNSEARGPMRWSELARVARS
jgi:hypothetical protein